MAISERTNGGLRGTAKIWRIMAVLGTFMVVVHVVRVVIDPRDGLAWALLLLWIVLTGQDALMGPLQR